MKDKIKSILKSVTKAIPILVIIEIARIALIGASR